MKIKKANIKRLASLSALGAGALGMGAGTADASSIVYSGVLDERVGFGAGAARHLTFMGPNGAGALLNTISLTGPQHSSDFGVRLSQKRGANGTQFEFLGGIHYRDHFVWAFPLGQLWGGAMCGPVACKTRKTAFAAFRYYTYGNTTTWKFTAFNKHDRYLLFEFTGGQFTKPLYGWAQLEAVFHGRFPTVTLVDWAYDTSGAQIPAGDTGTPEPSTFALTGLAALALGAKGLRAWREARKKAVAA